VLFDTGEFSQARAVLMEVHEGSSGTEAAEARYRVCRIDFELGNYKECEAGVFELIKQYPGYEFWKIKSLILLADAYTAMEDSFQAKAVLQNILNNTNDEGLRNEAQQKLDANIAAEEAANQPVKEDEMELDLGDPDAGTRIFEEMEEEDEIEDRRKEQIETPQNNENE
jgi:hypothetical protein